LVPHAHVVGLMPHAGPCRWFVPYAPRRPQQ